MSNRPLFANVRTARYVLKVGFSEPECHRTNPWHPRGLSCPARVAERLNGYNIVRLRLEVRVSGLARRFSRRGHEIDQGQRDERQAEGERVSASD